MEPRKSVRKPPGDAGQEATETDSGKLGSPVDLMKQDHQSILKALEEGHSATGAGKAYRLSGEAYRQAMQHFDIEESVVIRTLIDEGAAEADLHEFVVLHDLARILLADLRGGGQPSPIALAKHRVLTWLTTEMIAREEAEDRGIFAVAKSTSADMEKLSADIRARRSELTEQAEQSNTHELMPSTLRLDAFGQQNNKSRGERTMARNYDTDRPRDEDGRFTQSDDRRGGRYRDDDRDQRSNDGRGWYGDSRGHSEAAHRGWETRYSERSRDDDGRYGSSRDDDRYGSRGRSSSDRPRDDEGRFMSDDDRGGYRGSAGNRQRDDYDDRRSYRGRDDDDRHPSRGRGQDYDDDRRSYGSDRPRDDQGRFRSDDDNRSPSRGRGSGDHEGSGWYGDSRGHSDAARRGWENRR